LYFPDAAGIARNEIFSKRKYQTKAIQKNSSGILRCVMRKTSSENTRHKNDDDQSGFCIFAPGTNKKSNLLWEF
jgi:hypothetical protein